MSSVMTQLPNEKLLELADTYELGLGTPADPAAAKQWRERARAAEQSARKDADEPRSNQRVEPGRPKR